MTIARGFLIIALSAIAFAAGGGLLGYGLGVWAPGYYRGTWPGGRRPEFDPAEVGLGLGVSQGAVCGVLVGVAVVLAVAWYSSRRGTLDVPFPSQAHWRLTEPGEDSHEHRLTHRLPLPGPEERSP
jgi:hypothetical protein